jgi:glutamate-1-semialdehyde 2,1-aminomutase
MTDAPVRSPADAAKGDQQVRELFFFDLLNAGVWIARRGMINLSLPIGDAECNTLVSSVESFIQKRLPLLEGSTASR